MTVIENIHSQLIQNQLIGGRGIVFMNAITLEALKAEAGSVNTHRTEPFKIFGCLIERDETLNNGEIMIGDINERTPTELDEMLAHHNAKVDRLNRGHQIVDYITEVMQNITAMTREYRESNKNRQAFRKKYNRRPRAKQKKIAFMIKMQATGYMAAARLSAMISQPIPKYPAGTHSELAIVGESGPELIAGINTPKNLRYGI